MRSGNGSHARKNWPTVPNEAVPPSQGRKILRKGNNCHCKAPVPHNLYNVKDYDTLWLYKVDIVSNLSSTHFMALYQGRIGEWTAGIVSFNGPPETEIENELKCPRFDHTPWPPPGYSNVQSTSSWRIQALVTLSPPLCSYSFALKKLYFWLFRKSVGQVKKTSN